MLRFLLSFSIYFSSSATSCPEHGFCSSCILNSGGVAGRCAWCPLDDRCYSSRSSDDHGACTSKQTLLNESICPNVVPRKTAYSDELSLEMLHHSWAVYFDSPTGHGLPEKFSVFRTFKHSLGWSDVGQRGDVFAMIGVDAHHRIVLSFRGSASLGQIASELLERNLVPFPGHAGMSVNEFQLHCINVAIDDILEAAEQLRTSCPDCSFLITGHSLGGSLAQLAGLYLVEKMNGKRPRFTPLIYTFGSPRVGNSAFADYAATQLSQVYRVVNAEDIVPHVPPREPGYSHFGVEVYYPKGDYTNGVMCGYRECVEPGPPLYEDGSCSNAVISMKNPGTIIDHHNYFLVMSNGFCQSPQPPFLDFSVLPSLNAGEAMLIV